MGEGASAVVNSAAPAGGDRAAVARLLAPDGNANKAATDGGEISGFFAEVGRGVVAAQRLLDDHTRAYIAGRPPVPGTFRIPKVSAELKLQASVVDKQVKWIFSSETTSTTQSQTVSFDLVAAPPPPELLADYRRFAALGVLVVDGLTRAGLLTALRAASDSAGAGAAKARFQAFIDKYPFVLVLDEGGGKYVLVRAEAAADGKLSVDVVHADPKSADPLAGGWVASLAVTGTVTVPAWLERLVRLAVAAAGQQAATLPNVSV